MPVDQLGQPDLVGPPRPTSSSVAPGPGEGDVVPDGPGEEERLLGHDAELAPQRVAA